MPVGEDLQAAAAGDPEAKDRSGKSGWYRWYVVAVLAVAGALAQIDRQIMGLLTEPVKADLHLTDVQVSLLQGLAFVLFHSVMAFPLGYLSDRWPRRIVMAVGIFLWSMTTMACGFARSFAQLFSARLGVGIGEASLVPSVQSVLPDYFESDQLPRAFAIFQIGMLFGGGGAYMIGGMILSLVSQWGVGGLPFLGPLKPWQITFVLASLPGPLIALLMLTMREPPRRSNPLVGESAASPTGFRRHISASKWFLASHLSSLATQSIVVFGIVAWTPSYLIRTFGWTVAEAGLAYGSVLLVFGSAGTLIAGQVAQVWARRGDAAAAVRINILALTVSLPVAVAFPLVGFPLLALVLLAVFSFCVGVTSAMMPTILQLATPHPFRGRVAAFYVFATSAVGAALGPVAVAVVTDVVLGDPQRLREAIAIVSAVFGVLVIGFGLWTYREFNRLADT